MSDVSPVVRGTRSVADVVEATTGSRFVRLTSVLVEREAAGPGFRVAPIRIARGKNR